MSIIIISNVTIICLIYIYICNIYIICLFVYIYICMYVTVKATNEIYVYTRLYYVLWLTII